MRIARSARAKEQSLTAQSPYVAPNATEKGELAKTAQTATAKDKRNAIHAADPEKDETAHERLAAVYIPLTAFS
jgi:hypothetical protein